MTARRLTKEGIELLKGWILIDGDTGEIVCKRCGECEKPKLPMPIDAFIKFCQYFGEKHKFCNDDNA